MDPTPPAALPSSTAVGWVTVAGGGVAVDPATGSQCRHDPRIDAEGLVSPADSRHTNLI
jgi:hypothetical protein